MRKESMAGVFLQHGWGQQVGGEAMQLKAPSGNSSGSNDRGRLPFCEV